MTRVANLSRVSHDRDVSAFDQRAATYDDGYLGRLHRDVADRTISVALAAVPAPARILDVGCGTGYALRALAGARPDAQSLTGVDPAPAMVEAARSRSTDRRIHIEPGTAETLPAGPASFDLIVSITSFDHWADQGEGLRRCAAALTGPGALVLTDLFSPWLAPTMLIGRRGHARTAGAGSALLRQAGFGRLTWHGRSLLKTVVARH